MPDTSSLPEIQKPWTGDLDAMFKRHTIRVLTVYSKTFYTVDKGVQRGAACDAGRLFVEDPLETPLPLELASPEPAFGVDQSVGAGQWSSAS